MTPLVAVICGMQAQEIGARTVLPPPRPAEFARPGPPPAALPASASQEAPDRGRENPGTEANCLTRLRALYGSGIRKPDAAAIPASRDLACRVVDPVIVATLDTGATTIGFEPPVTLGCEMATVAAAWLVGSVQPLTRGSFGRELAGLRVGGGHECRRRNRAATGALSEHATGRALDIFAFVLAGPAEGAIMRVERPETDLQRRYLTAVRQSGCGAFSTSLGPGADAAHANHLHLDIQSRRSAAAKFCQ